MSQDIPKVRKRDKLRAFLGIQPSSRSVSPVPSAASSFSGSTLSLAYHPSKTPSSSKGAPPKSFKRGPSFEKDLVVLSTTYLLQDNVKLRELMVLILRLRYRDKDDKVSMKGHGRSSQLQIIFYLQFVEVLEICGRFCVDLAHFALEECEAAKSAIAEFARYVQVI